MDNAKSTGSKYCIKEKNKIKFLFNEGEEVKSEELKQNAAKYIKESNQDNDCGAFIYQYRVENYNFQEIFANLTLTNIFQNKEFGKLILLDQYGFSQIDEKIFKQLISYPKTDFKLFISSFLFVDLEST